MQMSATITKISAALLKAQSKMGGAVKDAKNPFFKSNYADLNSVREASIPVLNAEGISVLQPTVLIEGRNFVRTLLLHESGEFLASDTEIVMDKANNAQSAGSGISYARRYGLQSFLNVPTFDDDGEAAVGRTTSFKANVASISNGPNVTAISTSSGVNTSVTAAKDIPTTLTTAAKPVAKWKKTATAAAPAAQAATAAVTNVQAEGDEWL
jgi:hypothetical protein